MAEEKNNEQAQDNGQNNNAQDNSNQNSGGQSQEDKGNDSKGGLGEKLICPYCGGVLTPEGAALKFGGPLYKAAWEGIYSLVYMTRRPRYLCLNPKCKWGYYPRTRVRFVKGLAYISKNSIFEEHFLNDAIRRSHRQRKGLVQRLKESVKAKIAGVGPGSELSEGGANTSAQGDGAYHGSNPLAGTGGPQNYDSPNSGQGHNESEDNGAYRGQMGDFNNGGGQEQGYGDSEASGIYRGQMGGYDDDYGDFDDYDDEEDDQGGQGNGGQGNGGQKTNRAKKVDRS